MFILIILTTITYTKANIVITELIIPPVVYPNQNEVEIECRYDANFTMLNWFKGPNEFFRYQPGYAPSTQSFPVLGIGKVEMVHCGPTACKLKLGALSEEATGVYRCDIQQNRPLLFTSRNSTMEVYGHEQKRPVLEGMETEYSEGDTIQAECRPTRDAEIRWYINGREINDMRGSSKLNKTSAKFYFAGLPPTITVQCAEFSFGRLTGSKEKKAKWRYYSDQETAAEQKRSPSSSYKIQSLSFLELCSFVFILLVEVIV